MHARHEGAGQIEVIAGGMFSGKSEELVRRLRRAVIARQRVQVFKPALDTREAEDVLMTRDRRQLDARSVPDSAALRAALGDDVQVVGVDEVQFFDAGIVALAMELADRGVRVVLAGLDQDFERRPFGPMPALPPPGSPRPKPRVGGRGWPDGGLPSPRGARARPHDRSS